jgi:uncharacterized membrane protein YcaP (DUF421 family)
MAVSGLIYATTLVALNWLVSYATFRHKRLAHAVEGRPQAIIRNGHVYRDVMQREQATQSELDAALRSAGCACVDEVHFANRA